MARGHAYPDRRPARRRFVLAFLLIFVGVPASGQVPDRLFVGGDGASGYFCSIDASNGFLVSIHGLPGRPHQPVVATNQRDLFVLRRGPLGVSRLDLLDNTVVAHIPIGGSGGSDPRLAVSPDGKRGLVVEREAGRIVGVDLAAGVADREAALGGAVSEVLQAPGGDHVFLAVPDRGVVAVVALSTGAVTVEVAAGPRPTWLAASPDLLFVADAEGEDGGDRSLRLFDARTFAPKSVVSPPGRSGALAVAADGAKLLLVERNGTALQVFDVAGGRFTKTLAVGPRALKAVVDRQGRRAYVLHEAGVLEIVDTADLSVRTFEYPSLATTAAIVIDEDAGLGVVADPVRSRYSRFGLKGEWWDHVFQITSTCTHPQHMAIARNGPQRGWWIESGAPGRGYGIERTGDVIRVSAYLADSGRWLVAEGMPKAGRLSATAWTYGADGAVDIGTLALDFVDPARARLTLPGAAAIEIDRYDIVPGGVSRGPVYGMPETGWYWDEVGNRGLFFEVQGSLDDPQALIALSVGGKWYLAQGRMIDLCHFVGDLIEPGSDGRAASVVGRLAFQAQKELDRAQILLPDGQAVTLYRKSL